MLLPNLFCLKFLVIRAIAQLDRELVTATKLRYPEEKKKKKTDHTRKKKER